MRFFDLFFNLINGYKDGPTDLMELNKVSAVFGYLGAFFMSLVANVQIDVASIFPSL